MLSLGAGEIWFLRDIVGQRNCWDRIMCITRAKADFNNCLFLLSDYSHGYLHCMRTGLSVQEVESTNTFMGKLSDSQLC